jgi:hypothetical protein
MTLHRVSALLIAALALVGLIWQFQINGADPGMENWGLRAWDMLRYYTILTNILVVGLLGLAALGRPVSANQLATITVSIIMVGIIYRLLLAPAVPKPAPDWYPDFFMHVAVPVLVPMWWLAYGDKTLRLRDLWVWLSLPALYCTYALIRGWITGSYPYFFFDVGQFGLIRVLLNCLGLVAVFGLCGGALWLVARLVRRPSAGTASV